MGTVTDALRLARGELGVVESPKGSNRQKYGEWYEWNGVAWCAIWVSWVLWHSGTPINITTTKGFASVWLGEVWAKKHGKWKTSNPQPGDIVIYKFSHTGIVESVRPDGKVVALEGNTDVAGGGSGGRVMRQVRATSLIKGYITVDYSAEVLPKPEALPSGKLNAAATGVASSPTGRGYVLVGEDGGVFAYGDVGYYGNALTIPHRRIVDVATTKNGKGYWLVAEDGGVFSFGQAQFFGSTGGKPLQAPVCSLAVTPSGNGYWLVASDGGVFCFGDAAFYGSMGGKPLNSPVVALVPSVTGKGYYLFAEDGGVFNFGDAKFYGSMGGKKLNAKVVSGDAFGGGYTLVGADGGTFNYNTAQLGSRGGKKLNGPITDMVATPDRRGMLMVGSDGGVFAFGTAVFLGAPTQ